MIDRKFIRQLLRMPAAEGNDVAFGVLEQEVKIVVERRFRCIGETEKNRLAYECELIRATNTAKLFLYWADIVASIKRSTYPYVYSVHNCSLVAFCLGITEVNPLLAGSYVERLLTKRSTLIPPLFIKVPKNRAEEALKCLEEKEKEFLEINENVALPDLDPKKVIDFFKGQTYEDREILQSAAASLDITEQKKSPETIGELTDLLVYRRYAEFTDKFPSLLHQEDAVDLLVKAGLSYEEAECVRKAAARHNKDELNFYRKVFVPAASKTGYSVNEADAMFSLVEREIPLTICRACFVARAQYLYMNTFFRGKVKEPLCL